MGQLMATLYYDALFGLSLVLMIVYMTFLHKHFDIRITLIFVLIPVVNLGYALLGHAQTTEGALMANRLTYLGGCFLPLILTSTVLSLCHIKPSRWVRLACLALSTVVFLTTLSIGDSTIFYQSITFERIDQTPIFTKVYGPMHTVFIAMVVAYFLLSIAAMAYSYLRNKQVSRKNIHLLFLTEVVAVVSFFGGRMVASRIELIPIGYDFALIVYLAIIYRINLYDVTGVAIDSLVQTGDTGLMSVDFTHNYLGSNKTAKLVFPELNDLTVDYPLGASAFMEHTVLAWLEEFEKDDTKSEVTFERDDRSFLITITYLFSGKRKTGYQLFIADNTERQRYIKLLNSFNSELQSEVEQKTAHIVEMHDNLILSMAVMVEGRDNSTGGHIRRTSEGVRLLIAEMRHGEDNNFTDKFCRDLVKAAPMHDLGKIAVDDAVLRKPGRFTPEEYEKMKVHAAEGARIVHEILKGTDDQAFRRLAENVAHYHHERWDGSGYPEGLQGEEIPIEARIMAIADVYDALVSKRVYKESMSFEKAHIIIMDAMGSQFDPSLEVYYLRAKPRLEEYYSSLSA